LREQRREEGRGGEKGRGFDKITPSVLGHFHGNDPLRFCGVHNMGKRPLSGNLQ
jgi:hypothetical protein